MGGAARAAGLWCWRHVHVDSDERRDKSDERREKSEERRVKREE
jgi:hypothetical protein